MELHSRGFKILGLLIHTLSMPPIKPSECMSAGFPVQHAGVQTDPWFWLGMVVVTDWRDGGRHLLSWSKSESEWPAGCSHVQSCDHLAPCCTVCRLPSVWDAVPCSGLKSDRPLPDAAIRSQSCTIRRKASLGSSESHISIVGGISCCCPSLPSFSLWEGLFPTKGINPQWSKSQPF